MFKKLPTIKRGSTSVKENHSAAHLHINHEDARIPIYGPISIGHFVRFVGKQFYRNEWNDSAALKSWPLRFWKRTVSTDEDKEIHLNCLQTI
jgi:hypothetical protein